jgi:hypothetical protein
MKDKKSATNKHERTRKEEIKLWQRFENLLFFAIGQRENFVFRSCLFVANISNKLQ